MQKFSDAEVRDYATRVLALLNEQRKYFKSRSVPQLEKCKRLERELYKTTEAILGEFQQLRLFDDSRELMLPD